jgi:hypothetical protein
MAKNSTKLHQLLAIESDVRKAGEKELGDAHKLLQHPGLMVGTHRTYKPRKDDGQKKPAERQVLQVKVPDVIKAITESMTRTLDVTATRDYANCDARADVTLDDGTVLVPNAPAPYLLWLEKKLVDITTFIGKLPTLDPGVEWVWDSQQMCWKGKNDTVTLSTAKIPYGLELSPATEKHPAQVSKEVKDEVVGEWTQVTQSGAIPPSERKAMKDRVDSLLRAVKMAREKANQIEVVDQTIGGKLLGYLFGGTNGK